MDNQSTSFEQSTPSEAALLRTMLERIMTMQTNGMHDRHVVSILAGALQNSP